jgi:hypothetical protein
MKKIGLIALVVVLALGVIGVGYATWSSVLSINGAATAATWNVYFTGTPTIPADPLNGGTHTSVVTNSTLDTITITQMYPGYDTGIMSFPVDNASTISASVYLSLGTILATGGTGTPSGADLTVTVAPLVATPQLIAASTTDSTHFTVRIVMNSTATASGATYTIPVTVTASQHP